MPKGVSLLSGVPLIESPLFASSMAQMGLGADELRIAQQLHHNGFAVIDLVDPDRDARFERIKRSLAPRFGLTDPLEGPVPHGDYRIQDAWSFDTDVRAIATNGDVITLLGKLYGRPAIPFQTLNFPVGTEQHLHSDSIHFSSLPQGFMCGVWVAMEDIHPDAGPLLYVPGSHRWPVLTLENLGLLSDRARGAQAPFEEVWRAVVEESGADVMAFLPKKGQALIWAANLLHGGSVHANRQLTRWSQVTHYFFENCTYYTPAYSDPALGHYDIRQIVDIRTADPIENRYLGERYADQKARFPADREKSARSTFSRLKRWLTP